MHFIFAGFGANNDPVRGYVLVFLLSLACIMIGKATNCSRYSFLKHYKPSNYSIIALDIVS